MNAIPATLANMRKHYGNAALWEPERLGEVFAWSPDTGEECSANPGDYSFIMTDDDVLRDDEDNPMILAYRVTQIVAVDK